MNKFTFNLMFSVFMVSAAASANTQSYGDASSTGQSSYRFTQAFANCVKQHRLEAYDNESGGAAMSGLMNGADLAGKGALSRDRRYWSYMDCLNTGNSGTSQQALPTAVTCPAQGKIPAGVEGKQFSFNGSTWQCTAGRWSSDAGATAPTLPGTRPCAESSLNVGVCSITVPALLSGKSEVVTNTQLIDRTFHMGSALASCKDGAISYDAKTCKPQTCDSNKKLSWFSTIDGQTSRCEGVVGYDGIAMHTGVHRFFNSLSDAIRNNDAKLGRAEFICENNQWKVFVASCKPKPTSALDCTERRSSTGLIEFSCN